MGETLIARRYATALFKLALEGGTLSAINRDIAGIGDVLKASPEFARGLKNPVIPLADKRAIVNNIFTGRVSDTTLKFLNFLIEKKRIQLIEEVSRAFILMEEEHRGIAEAKIITARPAEKDILDTLDAGLTRKYKKKFAIITEENPAIMGGFLLYIKDKVYDFSVRNQLKLLREQLLGTR